MPLIATCFCELPQGKRALFSVDANASWNHYSYVFAKGYGDHMHDEGSRLLLQMNFESPFNNSGTLPEFKRKVKQ